MGWMESLSLSLSIFPSSLFPLNPITRSQQAFFSNFSLLSLSASRVRFCKGKGCMGLGCKEKTKGPERQFAV